MGHLLHLDSSLRSEGSRSRKLSAHFAERWRAENPDGVVTYRDLAADPVPHLDDVAFFAPFVPDPERTPEQIAAVALSTQLTDEVLAADTILIGLPLYNFGPPSTFKAWFDRIVSERTAGKLGDKEFVVVSARGGGYGPVLRAMGGTIVSHGSAMPSHRSASTTRSSSTRNSRSLASRPE